MITPTEDGADTVPVFLYCPGTAIPEAVQVIEAPEAKVVLGQETVTP